MLGFRRLLASLDLARGVCYRGWLGFFGGPNACLLLVMLDIYCYARANKEISRCMQQEWKWGEKGRCSRKGPELTSTEHVCSV